MKYIYGIIVIVELLLILLCAIRSLKRKSKLGKSVCIYEWLTFGCAIAFVVYTFVPGNIVTMFSKSIMLLFFDWLLIMLLYYTQYYTGVFSGVIYVKGIMIAFAICDSVMLFANTWTQRIFSIDFIESENIHVTFVADSFWYQAHFIFNYLVMTLLIFIYCYMVVISAKLYKIRYIVIVLTLFVGFLCDLATIKSDSIYDVSMIIYGIMSMMIYYLTFQHVPNELIEDMLSIIVKDMNNGIVCYDDRGRCVYYNELISGIYGENYTEVQFERMYSDWIRKSKDSRKDSMKFDAPFKIKGKLKHFEISYKRMHDKKGRHLCDYFIYIDRTELLETLKREKYRATHDSLTGLLTREQFYIDTHDLITKYKDTKFCIICSNIKDFKYINELFGIEKGNVILKKQAELMKMYSGEKVLCARIQNDRFAMCLPKERLNEKTIMQAISKMQEEFEMTSFKLHLFMGVYDICDTNEYVRIMCDKANIAADTIKDNYDSLIAHYDEHLLEISIEERRIIGEFDSAIDNKEFEMYLQPQVEYHGHAFGAEALVRWHHPVRGLLTPQTFIDVLEKSGLIYKLDRYMWELAARKLSEWKQKGYDEYHLSVNISAKDFYIIDIYDVFMGLIEKYDISPHNLKLEITETALMSDLHQNMGILHKLQNKGFKVEIDDFGSGYSSLNMLKDISADVLKIDMGFLRASENEIKGKDILESIIMLANKLGMEVITEGVEKQSQLDMLNDMGCKMFQGYFFSEPLSIKDFEEKYLK